VDEELRSGEIMICHLPVQRMFIFLASEYYCCVLPMPKPMTHCQEILPNYIEDDILNGKKGKGSV